MTSAEALQIFRDTGAFLEGHFVLRSGLHSRQFFQCALALQQMPVVERFGKALAEQVRPLRAATVVSPAMGGLVIGQEVARQLGARFIFTEKEEGKLALRRGFQLARQEPVIIVEDVVTQGGRVRETMELVRDRGARVLAIAMMVDRSDGTIKFDVPSYSLIRMKIETFSASDLPPDLAAIPAVKPGSK
jgi:orotate phosphoribosyltransferase